MAKFPVRGEWLLSNPKMFWRDNPPFAVLTVDFRSKTGTIRRGRMGAQDYAEERLDHVFPKLGPGGEPKFHAGYRIRRAKGGFDSGKLEATISDGYELEVEFTGTVETCVNAHPVSASSIQEGDLGLEAKSPKESAPPKHSITCAGDIAREFDSLVAENNAAIQEWAEETIAKHPGAWWAVGLAKTVYDVPVVLGQGMVDALRLGEGTAEATQAEGGWGVVKGVGQDALRLLQFVPAFKALKLVKAAGTEARVVSAEARALGAESRALNAEARAGARTFAPGAAPGGGGIPGIAARAPAPRPLPPLEAPRPPLPWSSSMNLVNRPGQICTWVAATQAVRIVKATAYVTLETLLSAGRSVGVAPEAAGTWVRELMPVLGKLGIRLRPLASVLPAETSAEAITALAARAGPGRVILFEISWVRNVQGVVKRIAHTMVAFNSPIHGVRILDRTGAIAARVADLEHIGGGMSGYRGIGSAILHNAYVVEDATVRLVPNGAGKLVPMVALPASLALHAVIPTNGPGAVASTAPTQSSGANAAQPAVR